jgi:putative transcriptional regulator
MTATPVVLTPALLLIRHLSKYLNCTFFVLHYDVNSLYDIYPIFILHVRNAAQRAIFRYYSPHGLYAISLKILFIRTLISNKKRKVYLTIYFNEYKKIMEGKLYNKKEDLLRNQLEELRKQKGIRQEELAAVLEVSRQTIVFLENFRYNPLILLAFKIARYFEMSIEEVFIYEEETK